MSQFNCCAILALLAAMAMAPLQAAEAQKIKFPSLIPFKKSQQQVEPIPLTDQAKPKGFLNLPPLPNWRIGPPQSMQGQPGQGPTLLERVQNNSQQFFRNTGDSISQFATQTNQSIKRSTTQTWNFLSQPFANSNRMGGSNPLAFPRPNWLSPGSNQQEMIKPPFAIGSRVFPRTKNPVLIATKQPAQRIELSSGG